MTTVTIGCKSIEFKGHTRDPIVCHAISGISAMVANYVRLKHWAYVIKDDDGYLKIYGINEKYVSDPLFDAMINALKDIEEEYPGNLKIKYV